MFVADVQTGMHPLAQDAGEETFELCRPQRIGQLLKAFGVLTTQEAVVQRLKADALLSQLAFEPFVAVEVELQTPRSVAADLEEGFAPLAVIKIEVVVVGDDGFVAAELKADGGAGQAAGAEGVGFLLSDADEDDGITHRSLAAQLMSALVFGFLVSEGEQGDLVV